MSNEESAPKPGAPPATTPVTPSATTPPAAPKAPVAPKAPAASKPAAPAKAAMPRRSFLSWMTLAWAAFTASMIATLTATGRFMFPNVLFEPPSSFKAGLPNEIQVGQVDERFKQRFGVWLVRNVDPDSGAMSIYALSTVCTHLGCTPDWKPSENKFKCPCHGSGYDSEGINFEGPAPRPMDRADVSLDPSGQILVDTAKLYDWPKGERSKFNDDGAFIQV